MSDCEKMLPKISAHADRELAPDEAREVEGHLASCPGCANEASRWRRVEDAARKTPQPADAVWDAMWDRAAKKVPPHKAWTTMRRRMWEAVSISAAAAAILVGAYMFLPAQADGRARFEVVSIEIPSADYSATVIPAGEGELPVIWLERS